MFCLWLCIVLADLTIAGQNDEKFRGEILCPTPHFGQKAFLREGFFLKPHAAIFLHAPIFLASPPPLGGILGVEDGGVQKLAAKSQFDCRRSP